MDVCGTLPIAGAAIDEADNGCTLIVSTYYKGVGRGKGLGTAGYSYEFVMQLFLPLLRRWGDVIVVKDASAEVERLGEQLRAQNRRPIHIGFIACQDMYLSPTMLNVVVPAWEFPDVPNLAFDNNPQNSWVATSNGCDMILAHVPFTAKALVAAGVTSPVREVPVPMRDELFKVPRQSASPAAVLGAGGYVFSGQETDPFPATTSLPPRQAKTRRQKLRDSIKACFRAGKRLIRSVTPSPVWMTLQVLKQQHQINQAVNSINHPVTAPIPLAGVVYTSIFNPGDGRKNWRDLITGFVSAMRDHDDATLVLKLVTKEQERIYEVVECYRSMAIPHRCRVVIIKEYLSDEQMIDLLKASSYYITTTKAEGNCLPLMDYLAAGRPGISPSHSAISDYFDNNVGFVIDSHPEPAFFPHEETPKYRTTWARLVWPSLIEQLRRSYQVAKYERRTYEKMSEMARARIADWLHREKVYPLLKDALDQVARLAEKSRIATPSRSAA